MGKKSWIVGKTRVSWLIPRIRVGQAKGSQNNVIFDLIRAFH